MSEWQLSCPIDGSSDAERVLLAHGEGGRLMRRLIRERIVRIMGDGGVLHELEDAARLPLLNRAPVLTTDGFVVTPLFFPGGDIGQLAVYGTVNDLAVSGSLPRYLALGLIIEEGLPLSVLDRVLISIAQAASATSCSVVTGDTKVVPRGAVDGLFIHMTGLGELIEPAPPGPRALAPGDQLLVSGPVGQHGIAVLCARENLGIWPIPSSDLTPLARVCGELQLRLQSRLRAMRDATRGGVAAVLHEWADQSGQTLLVFEESIPVLPAVRGVCELLGLDPIHVANEGTMLVAVSAEATDAALEILRAFPETAQARRIGEVVTRDTVPVIVQPALGSPRPLEDPSGSPLPRIC